MCRKSRRSSTNDNMLGKDNGNVKVRGNNGTFLRTGACVSSSVLLLCPGLVSSSWREPARERG